MSPTFHSQPCPRHVNCPFIAPCLSFPSRDDAEEAQLDVRGGSRAKADFSTSQFLLRPEIRCPSKLGLWGNLPAPRAVPRAKRSQCSKHQDSLMGLPWGAISLWVPPNSACSGILGISWSALAAWLCSTAKRSSRTCGSLWVLPQAGGVVSQVSSPCH